MMAFARLRDYEVSLFGMPRGEVAPGTDKRAPTRLTLKVTTADWEKYTQNGKQNPPAGPEK